MKRIGFVAVLLALTFIGDAMAENSQATPQQLQTGLDHAVEVNTFRMAALSNTPDAVERWGTPAFQKKWKATTEQFFDTKAGDFELKDFLAGAIGYGGCINEEASIIGLYNIWSDGALVVETQHLSGRVQLKDFLFVSGQTLRGEKLGAMNDLFDLYTKADKIERFLADRYRRTTKGFETFYPANGKTQVLPASLSKVIAESDKELSAIKLNTMYRRTQMFSRMTKLPGKNNMPMLKTVQTAVRNGTVAELKDHMVAKQDPRVTKLIDEMPVMLRSKVTPMFHRRLKNGAIVVLVNAETPRWIYPVYLFDKKDGTQDFAMRIFDLNVSDKLPQ